MERVERHYGERETVERAEGGGLWGEYREGDCGESRGRVERHYGESRERETMERVERVDRGRL